MTAPPAARVAAAASAGPSSHSNTASPLLSSSSSLSGGGPPIRPMRHPLPQPPVGAARQPRASSSSSSSRHHQHHSSNNKPQPRPHRTSNSRHSSYHPPSTSSSVSVSPEMYQPISYSQSQSQSGSPYYSSSHPSPASTTSSSGSSIGSSLRTPPDLLVNGASVGHHPSAGSGIGVKKAVGQINTWNGLVVKPRLPERNLAKDEIRKRKSLLKDLPQLPVFELPSPPPSPTELEPEAEVRSAPARDMPAKRRRTSPPPAIPSVVRSGTLTPTTLATLASSYRTVARELKHSADARASSASSSRPSYLAARPTEQTALEQLDAVLLFAQAFYLDDLARGHCVAKDWISLFGLLRYATNAQADLGNDVLLGICRLVEAAVLRKLHKHDSALLQRKLATAPKEEGGWEEVRGMVDRLQSDLERADRLGAQARGLISLANLAASYPQLCDMCIASTTPHTEAAAKGVDPSRWPNCTTFAFPLDATSPMPFIVAFGRSAVAQHARTKKVDAFKLVQVATT